MKEMKEKFKTTIDRFGRVVIPKKVRDDLGLSPKVELEVEEGPNGIVLHPILEDSFIVNKKGVLVVRAKATEPIEYFLEKDRQSRIKHILKDIR
ncbi:MAG: AbrB/MazE/SpoVT family DNA-binding domain-containing protein [Actinobacteria bacterium]|nr:AbrB/MazE/SpoVT family DNA-binding domain-containing protein [Actinomycetota bacterium]